MTQKGLAPILIVLILAALVGGYLIYRNQAPSTDSTSSPRAGSGQVPQPSPIPDPTANWKTYTNKDYHFSFKYPPRFVEKPTLIRGSGFTQEFKDQENKFTLTFSSAGNYSQVTGKAYVDIDAFIGLPYPVQSLTIDGQDGRQPLPRAGSENINSVMFFSKDSKFIYTLELKTGKSTIDVSETDIKEGQKLFEQIRSTFKFLDQNQADILNWKTYTDQRSNFSFKYPSGWKIDNIPDDTLGRYINFFEEGVTQRPTTNMHERGNEVFRIMLYGDETVFNNLKRVKPLSPTSITVSGKPALRSENQIDILVNNKVLHLEVVSNESKKYMDQILSTFKFLP